MSNECCTDASGTERLAAGQARTVVIQKAKESSLAAALKPPYPKLLPDDVLKGACLCCGAAADEWRAHCADQRDQDEDTALVKMVNQEARVEHKPQRKPRPKRVYLSAEALREKADVIDGELKRLNDAYYKKFAEWQETLFLSRKQKKYEKRQEYQKRNQQERLRQAGHKVTELDPVQLQEPMREESVLRLVDSDADTPEPTPVRQAPAADNGQKKPPPPGGKVAPKDKRVKR